MSISLWTLVKVVSLGAKQALRRALVRALMHLLHWLSPRVAGWALLLLVSEEDL